MGLRKRHHAELNKCNVSRERFAQLRQEYQADPVALQQIDVYDGESEYSEKFRQFRDAMFGRDNREAGLEAADWLRKNYPDV